MLIPMTEEMKKLKKSERTRQAILEAAYEAFRQNAYDQVGVREIAANAQVTGAMVNRYFGCKRDLFKEVLQDETDYSELYEAPQSELGSRLAEFLIQGKLEKKNGEELAVNRDRLILFVRSIGCAEAMPVLREALTEKITGPLRQVLKGEHTGERASLLVSHFFGFLLVHAIAGAACAVNADREIIKKQLAKSLQLIIDLEETL